MADQPRATRTGEVFLFQFLLHPLFLVVERDIALFRVAGMVALCFLAWAAAASVTACLRATGLSVTKVWAGVSAVTVVATCSMTYLGAGRVPGYRVVVVVALLAAVTGLARWWAGGHPLWAALVGASGVLVFTGKPTSAAALSLLLLVVLLLVRVRPMLATVGWALAGAAVASCLVLAAARMSPADVVAYLASGLEVEQASGAHSSWASSFGVAPIPVAVILALGPILYLPLGAAGHDAARNLDPRWPVPAQVVVGLVAPFATCLLGVWLLSKQGLGVQVGELVFPWPLGAAVLVALVARRSREAKERRAIALVLVLLALPYVATIGTNTNFALSISQAAVFWALALVAALSMAGDLWPRTRRLLLPTALSLVTTTLVTQVVWTADSLEGQEVHSATRVTTVLGGDLSLRAETATLLEQLRALSATHDLAGRPSIDLTGYGAGYQLILGTRPLGRASFFGTFAGAQRGAALALSRESCDDLRSAVVLYADQNPLTVAPAAAEVGIDLNSGYSKILSFHPSHGTKIVRHQTVYVLLPDPITNAEACPDPLDQSRAAPHVPGHERPDAEASGVNRGPYENRIGVPSLTRRRAPYRPALRN